MEPSKLSKALGVSVESLAKVFNMVFRLVPISKEYKEPVYYILNDFSDSHGIAPLSEWPKL